jgi:hypothetical protein
MTNELLNPYCFNHLAIRDVQLQNPIVLTTTINFVLIIMKIYIIISDV